MFPGGRLKSGPLSHYPDGHRQDRVDWIGALPLGESIGHRDAFLPGNFCRLPLVKVMGVTGLSRAVWSVFTPGVEGLYDPFPIGEALLCVREGNLSHPLFCAPSPELASGFPGNPPRASRASPEARHIGGTETQLQGKRGRTLSQPRTNTQNTRSQQLKFFLARHDQEASSPIFLFPAAFPSP